MKTNRLKTKAEHTAPPKREGLLCRKLEKTVTEETKVEKPTFQEIRDEVVGPGGNYEPETVVCWDIVMDQLVDKASGLEQSLAEVVTNLLARRSEGIKYAAFRSLPKESHEAEDYTFVLDLEAGEYVVPEGKNRVKIETMKGISRLPWEEHYAQYIAEKNYVVIFSTKRVRKDGGIGITEVKANTTGEAVFKWKQIMPEYGIHEIIVITKGSIVFDMADEALIDKTNQELQEYINDHPVLKKELEEKVMRILNDKGEGNGNVPTDPN